MTRTWLQRMLQQNDTDLLSYDFAESQPAWNSWWFRILVTLVGMIVAGYLIAG